MLSQSDSFLKRWPKTPPPLSPQQEIAREGFMKGWHEVLPKKYSIVEKFNHGWIASLPNSPGAKTIDIGAGLGEHAQYEDLSNQDYHFLDYREEFCDILSEKFGKEKVVLADIQKKIPVEDKTYDRVVCVHVLEHLTDLPAGLAEIKRILKDDGVFDVVLPCEGGLAYTLARKISAQRYFEKTFKMDYIPIVKNEHVNEGWEVLKAVEHSFTPTVQRFFPLRVPIHTVNLCVACRFTKKS